MNLQILLHPGAYGLSAFVALAMALALRVFFKGLAQYAARARLVRAAKAPAAWVSAGPVCVRGAAVPVLPLLDPVYNKPCVYYSVEVTEASVLSSRPGSLAGRLFNRDVRSFFGGKISLYHSDSGGSPFLLADASGPAPVSASGVEYLGAATVNLFERNPGDSAQGGDAAAAQFLAGIRRRRGLHLRAVIIREGDEVCAWGGAARYAGRLSYAEERAAERCLERDTLERLARSDRGRASFDADADGDLEGEELETAIEARRAEVQAKLDDWRRRLETEFKAVVREGADGKLVLAPAAGGYWLKPFALPVALRLLGGPAVFAAGLLFFLVNAGFLDALARPVVTITASAVPVAGGLVPDLLRQAAAGPQGSSMLVTANLGGDRPPAEADRIKITNLNTPENSERKACEAGDMWNCMRLGARYYDGRGVAKDVPRAVPLLEKACGSESQACTLLAFIRLNGLDGRDKAPAAAAGLLQRACDGGDLFGCGLLGAIYNDGLGVAKDYGKAAVLYRRACDGGLSAACNALAKLYADGRGVEQNVSKSIQLATKSCGLKDQAGCRLVQELMIFQVKLERYKQQGK